MDAGGHLQFSNFTHLWLLAPIVQQLQHNYHAIWPPATINEFGFILLTFQWRYNNALKQGLWRSGNHYNFFDIICFFFYFFIYLRYTNLEYIEKYAWCITNTIWMTAGGHVAVNVLIFTQIVIMQYMSYWNFFNLNYIIIVRLQF